MVINMVDFLLQAIIAVPIFLLEILFLYLWFSRSYLPTKGMDIRRFKRRLLDFRRYQKALHTGEAKSSSGMELFLETNRDIYEPIIFEIIILYVILYFIAIVGAVFVYAITESIGEICLCLSV